MYGGLVLCAEVSGQALNIEDQGAIVVPVAGASPDPEDLTAWVRERLAYFKVPAHWEIRDEPLPRNATGKVLKNVLLGDAENTFVED